MDGFSAAFAAWMKFGDNTAYIPMSYGYKELPEFEADAEIYVLDFSFSMDTMVALHKRQQFFVVLDHHKTVFEDLEKWLEKYPETDTSFLLLDNEHSGAVLAWNYFFPDIEVPWMFLYVEDRDLGRIFRGEGMDSSKEINTALQHYDKDFYRWDRLVKEIENKTEFLVYVELGRKLLRQQKLAVDDIMENASIGYFLGHEVPVVRTEHFQSEVGHGMCQWGYPFSVTHITVDEGERYSLRSEGGFDVSALAKSMGGGGHKNAAGFVSKEGVIPLEKMTKYGE